MFFRQRWSTQSHSAQSFAIHTPNLTLWTELRCSIYIYIQYKHSNQQTMGRNCKEKRLSDSPKVFSRTNLYRFRPCIPSFATHQSRKKLLQTSATLQKADRSLTCCTQTVVSLSILPVKSMCILGLRKPLTNIMPRKKVPLHSMRKPTISIHVHSFLAMVPGHKYGDPIPLTFVHMRS